MAWEIVKAFFIILGILMAIGVVFQIIFGAKELGKTIVNIPRDITNLIPDKIEKGDLKKLLIYMLKNPVSFVYAYLIIGFAWAFIWIFFFSWWW